MEILNISEVDDFADELKEKVKFTLIKGAYQVQDKARDLFRNKIPKADNVNDKYEDSLLDGIFAGKYENDKIKVTALGNRDKYSGTFRTRFFVGGTKDREVGYGYRMTKNGIKYVEYKKPHKLGKIDAIDCVKNALMMEQDNIHNLFQNIK